MASNPAAGQATLFVDDGGSNVAVSVVGVVGFLGAVPSVGGAPPHAAAVMLTQPGFILTEYALRRVGAGLGLVQSPQVMVFGAGALEGGGDLNGDGEADVVSLLAGGHPSQDPSVTFGNIFVAMGTRSGEEPFTATMPETQAERMVFGELVIDIPRHLVTVLGKRLELTATEFKLLVLLARRRGRVQSREQLLKEVWEYDTLIDTRTVDTHMRRLREKLGRAAKHLNTVRGVGYCFAEN